MQTAEVIDTDNGQTIRLPDNIRFSADVVSIRKEGEAVILEPVRSAEWPKDFFQKIRIDDPAFSRPDQGPLPPAPTLD